MSYFSQTELKVLGFRRLGENVRISKSASIYNPANIGLGDNVRIDDFCVLSAGAGGIEIGSYVHIAVFCSLIGRALIEMRDFSGLSSRVSIYSSSDDYSGAALTNPTVAVEFSNVLSAPVILGRHCIVGAGAVLLPGVELQEGVAVGALSLVTKSQPEFTICAGNPARFVRRRERGMLEQEARLRKYMQAVST
jgi:dTDP-4-amino-4,6-dideoxy-D-glucose acyltransferase